MRDNAWTRIAGSPTPLGATWVTDAAALNIALHAYEASSVTLLLYAPADLVQPVLERRLTAPTHRTARVWHCRVSQADLGSARYYAFRVSGAAAAGTRFDESKILLDPYAQGVFFPPAFDRGAACLPGSNAGKAPLGLLPAAPPVPPAPPAGRHNAPRHGHDLIIYEMHVRGFTKRPNSNVTPAAQGTFAGAMEKIPYLQALGITAVELLPVHQFDPGEGNYWGYMTLNFFAPHYQYSRSQSPDGAIEEFAAMVEAFHVAGIEVFMDVVYNHTTEGGDGGPTFSFRGIDNSSYYAMSGAELDSYVNHSQCGNDLRTNHPVVRRLIVDSIRHWTRTANVDGFRFDLASVFAFGENGSLDLEDPPIISEITSDPDLADVRLIAEPWTGDGSAYLMGRAFPGRNWRQWNDHARDTFRRFVRGDGGLIADLATRLYGSTDLFPDDLANSCRRWQSVNYVDSHDGFTMADLVSYTNDQQRAWDCGHDGSVGAPPTVVALRRQQVKNFCCLLMLSNGTPMFVAGDEFMNTQQGDANPYNKDDQTTWLDWSLAAQNDEVLRFFSLMIAFRKDHPMIGKDVGWGSDVTWYGTTGTPDYGASSHALAYHLRGESMNDADLYVMINGDWQAQDFDVQAAGPWLSIVDTAAGAPGDIVPQSQAGTLPARTYRLAPRSIAVLLSAQRP